MNATANSIAADLRTRAEARIRVCEIYVNQRCLRSHQWIIVSSLWNGRGLYVHRDGQDERYAVGPFQKGMPTCWTKGDADRLLAMLATEFPGESFRIVHDLEWWATELRNAQDDLRYANEFAAKVAA